MDVSMIKTSIFICLWHVSSAQYMPQMGQMPPMGQMPQMGQMQQMMPQGMPPMQLGGMPSMMPGAMPFPIPMAMPQPKLPVVVMPFHSKYADKKRKEKKKKKKKRRQKKDESCSSDEDDSSDSSGEYDFHNPKYRNIQRSGHGKHRREVLTPVISYVNKKGDVVYQEKIKNEKARDWLDKMPKKQQALMESSDERRNSREISHKQFKDKYKRNKRRGA